MKNTIKLASVALMVCVMGIMLTACKSAPGTNWIAPMVSINLDYNTKKGESLVGITYIGEDIPGVIAKGDLMDTRARLLPALASIPEADWEDTYSDATTVAGLTLDAINGTTPADRMSKEALVAAGAVRMATKIEYKGSNIDIRIGASVQEFSGHNLSVTVNVTNNEVMVLWQAADNMWYNIRGSDRTKISNQFNAGNDDITLNGNTVKNVANLELFIVVNKAPKLEERTNTTTSRGPGFDSFGGFVITYLIEQEDRWHGHFHRYETIAQASTALLVGQAKS